MMKEIRTEDAVGHILCHDITQIIKDKKKGVNSKHPDQKCAEDSDQISKIKFFKYIYKIKNTENLCEKL